MIRTLLIQGDTVAAAIVSEQALTEAERRTWLLGPDAEAGAELPPGEMVELTGPAATTPIGAGWRYTAGQFDAPTAAPPRRTVTPREFLSRLTLPEKLAIRTAAQADAQVAVWIDELVASTEVDLDHPETVAGLEAMQVAGLLTPERVAEIRA
jgi:hypothetical protein